MLSICLFLFTKVASAQKSERVKNDVALKNITPDIALATCFQWLPVADVPANQVYVQTQSAGVLSGVPWNIQQFKQVQKNIRKAGGKPIKYLIINEYNVDRLEVIAYCQRKNIQLIADLPTAWQLARQHHIWVNLPVERDTVVQIGKRHIGLHPLGKGFACSGLAMFVPDARLLHAGYFICSPTARYPVRSSLSSLAEWAINLEKLYFRFSDARWVVPGQGPLGNCRLMLYASRIISLIDKSEKYIQQSHEEDADATHDD
ncbi:MAG: hypothetical protein RMJ87_11945 [Cytophagales bacterium]|nr:hypothetical protein [Bernardetiaceae bacterium]MDW8205732.1 hypothetical protein [Cytophagales bacterium]